MSSLHDDPTEPDEDRPLFAPDTTAAPRVLGGRYTLEEQVGVGGRAVVWRAFDEALSRTVAVKVLRGLDTGAADLLRHEAATAGRAAHPGIVAVYDTGTEEDVAWLALEHVAGPTLLDVLRHHPTGLPPQVAAAIAEQTAVALGHAHRRGLVHRDVKPANLLLSADGVVKLADFGVAATSEGRAQPFAAGTRGYAAPEQLVGGDGADRPAVDVFALGVVLHECLTGRPAFASRGGRDGGELLSPRQVRPDVPRDLDEVVRRATRRDPGARWADGAALATALRPLVASDPFELVASLVRTEAGGRAVPAAAPATTPAPTAAGARPGPGPDWRWVVGGLVALVATAVLTLAGVGRQPGPTATTLAAADAGLPITRVEVFDPYGSLGDDAPDPVALVDGDAGTVWRTPSYPVPLRSLGTPGLGVWIDVGAQRAVEDVTVDLRTGGVTLELLAADAAPGPGATEADWRSLDRVARPGDSAVLTADGEVARYWLLWITELEPVGETWQAAVSDLRFRPAAG